MAVSIYIFKTVFSNEFSDRFSLSEEELLKRCKIQLENYGQITVSIIENQLTCRPRYIQHLFPFPFTLVWNTLVSVKKQKEKTEIMYTVIHPVAPILIILLCTQFEVTSISILVPILLLIQYIGFIYFMQLYIYRKMVKQLFSENLISKI